MLPGFTVPIEVQRDTADVRDPNGRAVSQYVTIAFYDGYIAMTDFSTEYAGHRLVESFDAVAGVQRDADVHTGDRVVVPDTVGGQLPGTYDVGAVRDTRAHLRVLLNRTEP